MHLCLALGLDGHFAPDDELRLHQVLVGHQAAKTSFRPLGRSVDPSEKLANFLQEKGVPTESAMTRATDAIKILGASSINEAFQTSNPWATLKGLASRPSTRFRWVHEHELKQHIAQQAKKKHGAFVPHAKQKKQSSTAKSVPQVDPTTLRLLPDTFVDADGDEIPQIAFSEVGQDATGLAFCTYQEARPFIEAAESISSTTLGLLINTEIPRDFWGEAAIQHLCFPALCTATDEPLLLQVPHNVELEKLTILALGVWLKIPEVASGASPKPISLLLCSVLSPPPLCSLADSRIDRSGPILVLRLLSVPTPAMPARGVGLAFSVTFLQGRLLFLGNMVNVLPDV
eukprot:s1521_g13.t1